MKEKNFTRTIDHYLDQLEYVQNISEECPVLPFHVHIEPTNACNLRCIHCIHNPVNGQQIMTRKYGMMEFDLYKRLIDEIVEFCTSITLDVQGEPLLHKEILDFVSYAKRKGLYVSLLTNATRLTEETTNMLIELELDRIVFSFDTVNENIYEEVRVRSKFRPTLKNILYFLKKNFENGMKTFICMSMILEKATLGEKENYEKYFRRLPIGTIFFSNLLNMSGYSITSGEIDMEKLRASIPRVEWPVCRVPWEDLTVNWDGSVVSCPLDFDARYIVGWIQEKPIKEIWNDKPIKEFRKSLLEKKYDVIEKNGKLCSECNSLWDPEYDIRRYSDFIKNAIHRRIKEFGLMNNGNKEIDLNDQKFINLISELNTISK